LTESALCLSRNWDRDEGRAGMFRDDGADSLAHPANRKG